VSPKAINPIPPHFTVGPSPWYVRNRSLAINQRTMTWREVGTREPFAGCLLLTDEHECTILGLRIYSYLRLLDARRLLVWSQDRPSREGTPRLNLALFDLEQLPQISDTRDLCRVLGASRAPARADVEPAASWSIPVSLPAGRHDADIPDWLSSEKEILILVDSQNSPADTSVRTVWRIVPPEKIIEVLPQYWYQNGNFDFGYEWITRIARDPVGRLVGDGIRMRPFLLDESGTKLERWLELNPLEDPGW